MLKLNRKIKHNFKSEKPFALRINIEQKSKDLCKKKDCVISKITKEKMDLNAYNGSIEIENNDQKFENDEIILIFPKENFLRRFFRPSANTNSILLTEKCDQRCIMCSQPPKNLRHDHFELYKEAMTLVPDNARINITGGEPTLHKLGLFDFLYSVLTIRPDVSFHILTNGQHFEEKDRKALSDISENVVWGIPLYSSIDETHDKIVVKKNAFQKLMNNFNHLISSSSRIELRTVLLKQNLDDLPLLSDFISTHLNWIEIWAIMQLENIGYARMNWGEIFCDTSINFLKVGRAIEIAKARNLNVGLYNFPLCTVPKQYSKFTHPSISDWKRKYLDFCEKCKKKNNCSGFFEWYTKKTGYKRTGAIL